MKKWKVVIVLALAQFVMVLDSTVMNVSISTIVKDLGTSVNGLQSAITFYTLTMAAFMLVGAKLGAKFGLLKTFSIGAVIYGIGSFVTGLSHNLPTLLIGWSLIEGIGAVLVIPAIAALIAVNYKGKDRLTAYAIIGGISGAAAAAGPLIGGMMTTYFSWRYVFFAETIIVLTVLALSRSFKAGKSNKKLQIDMPSVMLSAFGMVTLIFGMLQSKVWGWILPINKPVIGDIAIAPLGISIVLYMIVAGLVLIKLFYDRQKQLLDSGEEPLLDVSILQIPQLRSGIAVLGSQYAITAAVFFVIPIYLQMVLGLNALETGRKIIPLSVALILFSMVGTKLSSQYSPRKIVRIGQLFLLIGSISLLAAMSPELTGLRFGFALFAVGAGLGLIASQIGNVTMSSVNESKGNEVGGLQGSFQNLGSSLGTALIGSVLIASLTTGFIASIGASSVSGTVKEYVAINATKGVPIVPSSGVEKYALEKGLSKQEATVISKSYKTAQLESLRKSLAFLAVIALFSMLLSKNLPSKVLYTSRS
jgi:MFS family permease